MSIHKYIHPLAKIAEERANAGILQMVLQHIQIKSNRKNVIIFDVCINFLGLYFRTEVFQNLLAEVTAVLRQCHVFLLRR